MRLLTPTSQHHFLRRRGLPAGFLLILSLLVACDGQNDSQAQDNSALTTPLQTQGDTEQVGSVRAPEIALAEGNFDWPRLLGANFDGTGACEGIQFDWSSQP
ncbi:MAG: hypothetical protein AAFU85_19065, partial [Planctomycetota bacterium]